MTVYVVFCLSVVVAVYIAVAVILFAPDRLPRRWRPPSGERTD